MEHIINNKQKKFSIVKIILWAGIGILAAIFFSAVFAVAVKYLWNWLITDIFNLKEINYLQAFGLVLLARLLVGGWHKGHHENGHKEHSHHFFAKKINNIRPDDNDFNKKNFMITGKRKGKKHSINILIGILRPNNGLETKFIKWLSYLRRPFLFVITC